MSHIISTHYSSAWDTFFWYTVMATGTTVELTEIQCVTAKVQEVKDSVHTASSPQLHGPSGAVGVLIYDPRDKRVGVWP